MKYLLLFAQVVVKTANVVIARCYFAEDGTELLQLSACRTCSTLIFPRSINRILICVVAFDFVTAITPYCPFLWVIKEPDS